MDALAYWAAINKDSEKPAESNPAEMQRMLQEFAKSKKL